MADMKSIIDQSFCQYAGAVLQSRALVDVRDFVKPSARQIFYCLDTDKFLPNKPFKKTLKAIGSVARMYIHGDSSAEGVIMRASQEFAMRYPLVEVEGNNGNLMMTGNWAAPRYTAARLTPLSVKLFEDIDKDTISEWRDNYDDTEQYPAVLPTKGFFNIVNGCLGIGVGAASSIPQFNIKDINKALETLLLHPNCTFNEIYCRPDFATGAFLINEPEVKAALQYGSKSIAKDNGENGASCKLRAKIDYNKKENCLIVSEIPYGVYTNTICGQLEAILEDKEKNPGIDRFNDLTGVNPNIKIYLVRGANPDVVESFLYKNTSLQYHYAINMTMLDEGRFPKVFTWKETLQAHINHEKNVYRRGFEFDLNKIKRRIHIIDGLLICLASIDEVVQTIKSSNSTKDASENLQNKFLLDEEQAKAVLDMKLSRLAHLEVQKLENEKSELQKEQERIEKILNDETLFNNELIAGWRATAAKFGDDYRTKVITVVDNPEDKEIETVKPEECVVITTQGGKVKRVPAASFRVQKRNTKGTKSDEVVIDSVKTNTIDTIMFFTDKGKMYRTLVDNIPSCTNAAKGALIRDLVKMDKDENVMAVSSLKRKKLPAYAIFITSQGKVKKTNLSEYFGAKKNGGIAAIKLAEGDKVVNVIFMDTEDLVLITKQGMSIRFDTSSIGTLGRVATGVVGIKLNKDDEVIAALPVHKETDQVAIVSQSGLGKRVELSDFTRQNRGGKGVVIYKNEPVAAAAMVCEDDNLLISGNNSSVCISVKDIPILSRTATGNILIKNNKVLNITKL